MKKEVIELVIEQQNKLVEHLKTAVDELHTGADIDEEDTIDPEDFSHQTETGDMMLRMKQQLAEAQRDLEQIHNLDQDPSEHVQAGTLVQTDKMNFLVCIPTKPFDFKGKKTLGISTEAPLYKAMLNKVKGDKFTFGDDEYTVENVE